jgi:ribose 5-phosphate isomerase A
MDPREDEKRAAAQAAAQLVEDGMRVGLGTGTTVAHFLPALARRGLDVVCVATSVGTEQAARALGLQVQPFDVMDRLDVAVDGADQVALDLWLVKGGGGAHTREKVVAEAADRFLVVASSNKLVKELHPPIPLEVVRFGLAAIMKRLSSLGEVKRRESDVTPDGNVIVDYLGPVEDPGRLSIELKSIAGVVEHGLFPPEVVSEVLVGRSDGSVDRLGSPATNL